jgi:hypothetical protein
VLLGPVAMATADKQGTIYLINRDSLGRYNSSIDKIVQEQSGINGLLSTPTFWNNALYFVANGDYPKVFSFLNAYRLARSRKLPSATAIPVLFQLYRPTSMPTA